MFCTKCGQKLPDGNLFCEYCGAKVSQPKLIQNTKAVDNKIATPKKPMKKRVIIIFAVSTALVLVLLGLLTFLVFKRGNQLDGETSYYKSFDEDDVVFPDNGEAYVDNQLLVTVKEDVTQKELKSTVKEYKGKIVGHNVVTNEYQVEFSNWERNYSSLLDLANVLEKEDDIESISLNFVYYNNTLIGSFSNLDNSLMGISTADYNNGLVGDIKVALVGANRSNSGLPTLLPDISISDVEFDDNELVSMFGWKSEVGNKMQEGCEIIEIASDLSPTYEDDLYLYEETARFIGLAVAAKYDFVMMSSAQSKNQNFINKITDEEACLRIINVGGSKDYNERANICAEGNGAEALDYAVGIAVMSWTNYRDLSGENIKDIITNSYNETADGTNIGLLDAGLSVDVAKKLGDMMATATDSSKKVTKDDILNILGKGEVLSTDKMSNLEKKLKDLVNEKGYANLEYSYSKAYGDNAIYDSGIVSADFGILDSIGIPYMIVYEIKDGEMVATIYEDKGDVKEIDSQIIKIASWAFNVYYSENSLIDYDLYMSSLADFYVFTTEGGIPIECTYSVKTVQNQNGLFIVISSHYWNDYSYSIYKISDEGIDPIGGLLVNISKNYIDNSILSACVEEYDNSIETNNKIQRNIESLNSYEEISERFNQFCKEYGLEELCVANDADESAYSLSDSSMSIKVTWEFSDEIDDSYSDITYSIKENSSGFDFLNTWWRQDNTQDSSDNDKTTSEISDVYKSYYDYIEDLGNVDWEYGSYDGSAVWDSFQLIDMDEDGTEELFIRCNSPKLEGFILYQIIYYSKNGLEVYEEHDGVAPAGGYRGSLYYLHGTRKIHSYSYSAPYNVPADTIYLLQGGEEKYVTGGSFSIDYDNLPENYTDIYEYGDWMWDDEVVTEDEYKAKFLDAVENINGIELSSIECMSKSEILEKIESDID